MHEPFPELLLKLANEEDARHISDAQLLTALAAWLPERRLARFHPIADDALDIPPAHVPGISWADGAYHPTSVDDVQKLVAFANAKGLRVRVAGAQHSTKRAIYSQDSKDLRIVLDGALREVRFLAEDADNATVLVGGGCYLGVNPEDPSSTSANSLNGMLEARSFALPILGGISHQSVAGFLQTSSAGGSLTHGFSDAIQAIELVDGTGEVRWLTVSSDAFLAAAVSVGLFGIITHVLLTVRSSFVVSGTENNHEVDDDESLLRKKSGSYQLEGALADSEYLHLNWFPQRFVRRVSQWQGARDAVTTPRDPYDTELKSTLMNVVAAFVLALTSGVLAIDPNGKLAQRIVGALLKRFVSLDRRETFRDRWLHVLPCDDNVKVDTLLKIIFTEIWLPLEQLTPALDRLHEIMKDQAVAGNFAVELYGAANSPFWLSPSYDRKVVRVDVFWWAYSFGDPRKHFTHFWNALLDLPGARLHWGKHLPDVGGKYGSIVFGPAFLRNQYPRLDDWLTLRKEMDPGDLFLTEYWRQVFGI